MENQDLFDRQVGHLIATRLHQQELYAAIDKAVASEKTTLSNLLRSGASKDTLTRQIQTAVRELYTLAQGGVTDFITAELDFQKASLTKSVGDWFQVRAPSQQEVVTRILSTPAKFPKGAELPSIDQAFTNMSRSQINKMNAIVTSGLASNTDKDLLVRKLAKNFDVTEAQAKTILTTGMTRAAEQTKLAVAEANSDIIAGFVFTAILDSHTTRLCGMTDGLFEPVDHLTRVPPLHWGCRSSLVPVLKSKETMLDAASTRVNKEALLNVPLSDLGGDLPANETFSQWLLRQPMAYSTKLLGSEENVSLFQRGAIRLADFFNSKGARPLSLGQLRILDANSTFRNSFDRNPIPLSLPLGSPGKLVSSADATAKLRQVVLTDVLDSKQAISLTDYKGVTLVGKRSSRLRSINEFDEANNLFDPFTGEQVSSLFYHQDYTVYQERLDFMRRSKLLSSRQKDWIANFADGLGDSASTNQKSAVVEALRVTFERALSSGAQPWQDYVSVFRAEMNYSTVNVSKILDRRSRAAAEMFLQFGAAGESPRVQILGRYYTFEDLLNNKLANQQFIKDWPKTTGRALAAKLFVGLDSPPRAYLLGLRRVDKGPPKFLVKWLEENVKGLKSIKFGTWKLSSTIAGALNKSIPTFKQYDDFVSWWTQPRDPVLVRLKQAVSTQVQRVLDLQFLYMKDRRALLDQAFFKLNADSPEFKALDQHIQALQSAMALIASGEMTDYDGLAISIGKGLYKVYKPVLPFYKPTLQDYHLDGSRLLDSLVQAGILRVQSRGIVRRAILDLETGRLGGNWKDTVSREVMILDPNLLALQQTRRAVIIADRIGAVNNSQRYFVKAGSKTYWDSRGNDTGISIITRSAAPFYDERLVDSDFSTMLNHTMSTKYSIDKEFSSFFLDLARFRDRRGRVDYFDELNQFRHEVVARGEQGYGLLETLRFHLEDGRPFTALARIDGRGRLYYNGYLTPTTGELGRPFLNSAVARPVTVNAVQQIQASLGSLVGDSLSVLTEQGRLDAFHQHEQEFLEIGRLITSTTQRDQRLRNFLTMPLVQATDGVEAPKLARFALEYYRINQATGGDIYNAAKLSRLATSLMGEVDASASGLQMIALSTGNRAAAYTSNLFPTPRKQRIYDLVAQDTVVDPRFQQLMQDTGLSLSWEDLQKAAKYQVLVALYGAGKPGQVFRVTKELSELLEKRDITFVTRKQQLAIQKTIQGGIKAAISVGAEDVASSLQSLQRDINAVIRSGERPSPELIAEAQEFSPVVAKFVERLTAAQGTPVGPDVFKTIASIMSEKMAQRAPVTQEYITFWKKVGQRFAEDTQTVDMPWVTLDGKKLYQRYRTKLQEEVRFYDPQSGRYVRNVYQTVSDKDSLLGKGSLGTVRLGAGVNGTHMNDASIVRMFHLWGAKNNVPTTTIHDAVFINITDLEAATKALKQIYANASQSNQVQRTLDAMFSDGLSRESYKEFVAEARRLGLTGNPLSYSELLQDPPPGLGYYAWGP
jgi:SPP1 gp7 family putative phage head morphogenesis protein